MTLIIIYVPLFWNYHAYRYASTKHEGRYDRNVIHSFPNFNFFSTFPTTNIMRKSFCPSSRFQIIVIFVTLVFLMSLPMPASSLFLTKVRAFLATPPGGFGRPLISRLRGRHIHRHVSDAVITACIFCPAPPPPSLSHHPCS